MTFSCLTHPFYLSLLCTAWGWLQRGREREVFGHHIWRIHSNSKCIVTAGLSWYFEATSGLYRENWPKWFARAIGKMVWSGQTLLRCLSFLWSITNYSQSNLYILNYSNFIFLYNQIQMSALIFYLHSHSSKYTLWLLLMDSLSVLSYSSTSPFFPNELLASLHTQAQCIWSSGPHEQLTVPCLHPYATGHTTFPAINSSSKLLASQGLGLSLYILITRHAQEGVDKLQIDLLIQRWLLEPKLLRIRILEDCVTELETRKRLWWSWCTQFHFECGTNLHIQDWFV